ncbi:unnamed protein product [Microthlaspi erraticum]|uniref:ACT domain-containing protein n=1 Tax=Microthlaspi erraticum TaxID=1685480 RepID=A0A6D2IAD2_9BRAS|nr:unnamed protein product [Microthlaspi erraticum]
MDEKISAEDVLIHMKLMKKMLEGVGIVVQVVPLNLKEDDQSSEQPSNPALKEDDQAKKDLLVQDPGVGIVIEAVPALVDHHVGAGDNATLPTEHMMINFVSVNLDHQAKAFHELSFLLGAELGLQILETSSFASEDGLSLDVFVVDGWSREESQRLEDVLRDEIIKFESRNILGQSVFSRIFFDSYTPKFSNRKPNKASIFDAPVESLRKHLVVGCSERLFNKLYGRAEEDPSFALKLIRGASFIQRNKARLMSKLLKDKSCEYTHTRAFNKKFAALSVAKATATLAVAALFGVFAVGSGIIPAMEEKEDRALQLQEVKDSFNDKLAGYYKQSRSFFQEGLNSNLKKMDSKLEGQNMKYSKLEERVRVLEEAGAKKSSWFGEVEEGHKDVALEDVELDVKMKNYDWRQSSRETFLHCRVQELETQLDREKDECKRITSRTKKFMKEYRYNMFLAGTR